MNNVAEIDIFKGKSMASVLRPLGEVVQNPLLKTQPAGDPVYRFINKKRAEGNPYLVYMTADAHKFERFPVHVFFADF